MKIVNKLLSLTEFENYIKDYYFGPLPANKLVIHHTLKPNKDEWERQVSIDKLKTYYEGRGWDVGSHLFVAEEGIWLFTPMIDDGIHAAGLNRRSIGIEVVGDYNYETWSGKTKENAIGAIRLLKNALNLSNGDIYFHRDVGSKTCPGLAITKDWLFNELDGKNILPKTQKMKEIEKISALPSEIKEVEKVVCKYNEKMIPLSSLESISFVIKNDIFDIKTEEDVEQARRFHRLYEVINGNKDE